MARLRVFLDLAQKEFADLVGLSCSTIQQNELGTLRVSTRVAHLVWWHTGISPKWLQGEDPKAPMIDRDGNPYTKKTFRDTQKKRAKGKTSGIDQFAIRSSLCGLIAELLAAGFEAYRTNRFDLFELEASRWLKEGCKKFCKGNRLPFRLHDASHFNDDLSNMMSNMGFEWEFHFKRVWYQKLEQEVKEKKLSAADKESLKRFAAAHPDLID